MTGARLLVWQLRYEQKSFWRNPQSAIFTFLFPVMFLVIFASLNTGGRVAVLGGLKYNQYFIPAIVAYGIMTATYMQLAITLTLRRDSGVLKRYRATPLPAWGVVGGMLLNAFAIAVTITIVTTGIGMGFYGVTFPGHTPALVLALLVGALSFSALGVAVSTFVPNGEAAPAVVNGLFLPLALGSGVFFPLDPASSFAHVAGVFPVRHFVAATFAAFDPRLPHDAAHGYAWWDLGVLALWGVAAGVVAVRRFRWEPRR
ncbi:MAG: ABC transporter permease [Actinomycetota bacterium]|nr:ABC transporter permease [Actinomycetota bacterium]